MPITWKNIEADAGKMAVSNDFLNSANTNMAAGIGQFQTVLNNEKQRQEDNREIVTDNNTLSYQKFLNSMSPEQLQEAQASGAINNQLGQYGKSIDQNVALNGFNDRLNAARSEFNAGVTYDNNVRDEKERPTIQQFKAAIAADDDAAVAKLTADNPGLSNLGDLTNEYNDKERRRLEIGRTEKIISSKQTMDSIIQDGFAAGKTEREIQTDIHAARVSGDISGDDQNKAVTTTSDYFAAQYNMASTEKINYNTDIAKLDAAYNAAVERAELVNQQAEETYKLNEGFNSTTMPDNNTASTALETFKQSGFDQNPTWGTSPDKLINDQRERLLHGEVLKNAKGNPILENGKPKRAGGIDGDLQEGEAYAIITHALKKFLANSGAVFTENLGIEELNTAVNNSLETYLIGNAKRAEHEKNQQDHLQYMQGLNTAYGAGKTDALRKNTTKFNQQKIQNAKIQ